MLIFQAVATYARTGRRLQSSSWLVIDVLVTYHVPCLESHFKGFHLALARLPGLFGRLLRVEVKKTILRSRKERTHLLNSGAPNVDFRKISVREAI